MLDLGARCGLDAAALECGERERLVVSEGATTRRRRLTRGADRNQRVEMRAHVTQQPVAVAS